MDSKSAVKEIEVNEDIPKPPKPFSKEVDKCNFKELPIIPTPKSPNQVETAPIKNNVASYTY